VEDGSSEDDESGQEDESESETESESDEEEEGEHGYTRIESPRSDEGSSGEIGRQSMDLRLEEGEFFHTPRRLPFALFSF
jgi:hypothetical protein